MSKGPVPFFATEEDDEEIEKEVQAEMTKTRRMSNLRNANGVDYAPWMGISEEDETRIRQMVKEKTEARRRRQEEERSVSGNLYMDSQAQELSGGGLKNRIIDGQVELEWATKDESSTKGYMVKRRQSRTTEFEILSSYDTYPPLASKGEEGGVYRYLDSTVTPGGWMYRITECDKDGSESDLCQCLVEVQTEDEQKAALIAGVGIAVVGIAAVVAGLVLDPYAG